jgi:hypothetical protein
MDDRRLSVSGAFPLSCLPILSADRCHAEPQKGEMKPQPARSEKRLQLDGTNDLEVAAGMEEAAGKE